MLRVESNTDIRGFTEFEEDILFDEDDPDFEDKVSPISVPFIFRDANSMLFREKRFTISPVSSNMSLASVHPAELHSSHSSLTTLSHSLDDITALSWSPQVHSDHVMTIEELRNQMSSCFSCGVSWSDHHVSLDCTECGGYALERPCPTCEGTCGEIWKRDLTRTHATSKARWQGECKLSHSQMSQDQANTLVAQELCSRLEKLSATS